MKAYVNNDCKKIRKSHILEINCAYCQTFLARYQKVGKSNLVKMYYERIIESSVRLDSFPKILICPGCGKRIATRYTTKKDKKIAYRLMPAAFHKKNVGY